MMPVFEADMVRKGRAVRFVWLYPKGIAGMSELGVLNGAAGAFEKNAGIIVSFDAERKNRIPELFVQKKTDPHIVI